MNTKCASLNASVTICVISMNHFPQKMSLELNKIRSKTLRIKYTYPSRIIKQNKKLYLCIPHISKSEVLYIEKIKSTRNEEINFSERKFWVEMTKQNRCIHVELYGSQRGITRGSPTHHLVFIFIVAVSHTWICFAKSILALFKGVHFRPILPIWGHVNPICITY